MTNDAMSAEEIVRGLLDEAERLQGYPLASNERRFAWGMKAAAAKIAELNDFTSSQCAKLMERIADLEGQLNGKTIELTKIREAIKIKGGTEHAPTEYAYLAVCAALEKYRAQLAASQQREREAAQWANEFYAMLNHRRLFGFTDNGENSRMDPYDKWRGHQEAGEAQK